jgi:hypothetical protein
MYIKSLTECLYNGGAVCFLCGGIFNIRLSEYALVMFIKRLTDCLYNGGAVCLLCGGIFNDYALFRANLFLKRCNHTSYVALWIASRYEVLLNVC